jgi:23S rRNA pseudouridine2605 synthase
VPRTYHIVLAGVPTPAVLERIQRGVWLAEGKTGPMKVHIKKRMRTETVLDVTLHEGMNREVRRIFARFGLKVKRLVRIRMGPLSLSGLGRGSSMRQYNPIALSTTAHRPL